MLVHSHRGKAVQAEHFLSEDYPKASGVRCTSRPPRSNYLVLAIWSLVPLLLLCYGFYKRQPLLYVLVALVLSVTMFPIVRNWLLGKPTDIGEPVFFVMLLYLAHFAMRAVYLDHVPGDAYRAFWGVPPSYSASVSAVALSYVLIGLVVLSVMYYSPIGKLIAYAIPRSKLIFAPVRVNRTAYLSVYPIIGLGLVGQFLLFLSGYGTATTGKVDIPYYLNLMQTLASLFPVGVTLHLTIAASSKGNPLVLTNTMLILACMITSLLEGWRGFLLSLLWMVLLPIHYLRRRIGLVHFALAGGVCLLVTLVLVVPVLSYYRTFILSYSLTSSLNLAVRGVSLELGKSLQFLFNRMIGLDSLMLLVQSRNRLYGRTLVYTIIGFVPRVLWPGKPNLDVGRYFAIAFWGQPTHVQNSISVMNVGELLWNFDLPGVIVGMAFLGVLYRVIYEYFLKEITPGGVFMYTTLFTRLTNIESGIGILLTSLFLNTIVMMLVLAAVRLLSNILWVVGSHRCVERSG